MWERAARILRHSAFWACLAYVVLGLLLFDPKPFIGGDNFRYMLLAEALRSGQGYREIWTISVPVHTLYPPVYPLVLAAIGVVSDSVIAFKLLSLAFSTAAVAWATILLQRRTRDRSLALVGGILVASIPALVEYSHWVLSEAPFIFFVMFALYAFERDRDRPGPAVFGIGVGATALAMLTRSAGYPLVLAAALDLAARRRWKRCAILVGACGLAAGAWWMRNRWVTAGTIPYSEWFLFRDPYRPELGTVSFPELLIRVVHNLGRYVLAVLPQSYAGRDVDPPFAGALGIVLASLAALGALRRIRRLESPELFSLLYLGVILLWPEAWTDQRFLLPLLPLTAVYIVEAVTWAFPPEPGSTGGESRRRRLGVPLVLVGAFVFVAVFGDLRAARSQLPCTFRYWRGDALACHPDAFADFLRAAEWAGQHTESDAAVINRKPEIFYWISHRRGDLYPYTMKRDSLIRVLESKRADYVVVDRLSATTYRYLVPAIQAYPERFAIARQVGNPPTYILQYRPAGEQ